MPWIFRYFWFTCAVFMLINVLIWRHRLMMVVERGAATRSEVRQFIRWVGVCLIGGPILLGLVGVMAGWTSPFCAGVMRFTDLPSALVSLISVSGSAVLLWWVWRGNGADFLARVGPALGQRPTHDRTYSPAHVRLVVTAMVLLGGVGSVIMWRTMPLPPELGCPIAISGGVASPSRTLSLTPPRIR
jgi:hypothetical protein